MKRVIIIMLVALAAATSYAGDCQKLWPHLEEARENLVLAFECGNMEQMAMEAENLVFWDAYIQVECSRGEVINTPVVWLAKKGMNDGGAYLAGFMFWMHDQQEHGKLDITPVGLVRGRSFE
jgi:hypothetical protein